GAGMAGGRQERTGGPAGGGGPHPTGRNEVEDPGAAGVAARRGGTTGERATTRQPGAAGTSTSARTRAVRQAEAGAPARVSRSSPAWAETPKSDSAPRQRRRALSRQGRETP